METSVSRYDFAPITKSETTSEGFLRVWGRTARVGTQLYRRADGSQVREYRPPEEVSNPESLSTFGMTPVTYGHPPILLDSTNTKLYQTGYSGSKVHYSDGFVEVCLTITDADSIEKINRGDATELSAGYKVDYDPTPGVTPGGEAYDGVQRNIRVNHIAVVPRGRAGPEVRLLLDRMDAADAVAIDPDTPLNLSSQFPTNPSPRMATVKLDGLEIELPSDAAGAVQSYVRDLERKLDAAEATESELRTALDSVQSDLEALSQEKAAAEGRADALVERVDELESGSGDRLDTAQIDQLVQKRLTTLQHLAPAFDDDFHFDGIDDAELYSQAFTNLTGNEPPEDADTSYIQGAVDGILAQFDSKDPEDEDDGGGEGEEDEEDNSSDTHEDRADSSVVLQQALRGAGNSSRNPIAQYHADQQNAWKKPLTATK